MTNDVLSVMAARRSHRAYKPDQLTKEQLDAILLAALQSPSAVDGQPWHFSVVQNKQLLNRVTQLAHQRAAQMPPEQRSRRFEDPAFHLHYHAPTVIFLSAQDKPIHRVDCGIAVQQIALAAQSLGLGSVIVALARLAFETPEAEELQAALGFPPGHQFIVSIAIGTPDDQKAPHPINWDKVTLLK